MCSIYITANQRREAQAVWRTWSTPVEAGVDDIVNPGHIRELSYPGDLNGHFPTVPITIFIAFGSRAGVGVSDSVFWGGYRYSPLHGRDRHARVSPGVRHKCIQVRASSCISCFCCGCLRGIMVTVLWTSMLRCLQRASRLKSSMYHPSRAMVVAAFYYGACFLVPVIPL